MCNCLEHAHTHTHTHTHTHHSPVVPVAEPVQLVVDVAGAAVGAWLRGWGKLTAREGWGHAAREDVQYKGHDGKYNHKAATKLCPCPTLITTRHIYTQSHEKLIENASGLHPYHTATFGNYTAHALYMC